MQSCSKLLTSKFSKPKISNTAMEWALWSPEMTWLILPTSQVNRREYIAFDSASLEAVLVVHRINAIGHQSGPVITGLTYLVSSAWSRERGVWKYSPLVRVTLYMSWVFNWFSSISSRSATLCTPSSEQKVTLSCPLN